MPQKNYFYLALLRGINVGGTNIIPMADLKRSFEGLGFAAVTTYIQSGNVLFAAAKSDPGRLAAIIEERLAADFSCKVRALVVTRNQLMTAVEGAPRGFGGKPKEYRYDVVFLIPPLTPAGVMDLVSLKEGVDTASSGKAVLYFTRLISRASQSRFSRIARFPEYQYMTIRNWNTTRRLWELMKTGTT